MRCCIALLHLLRITRRARQPRLFQGGDNLRMFQAAEVVVLRRLPPVAQVEADCRLDRIEGTARGVPHIAGLHPVNGTGRAEGHQRHQHPAVKGKEGGEVLLPPFRQQGFQPCLFGHEHLKRCAILTGRGVLRQAAVRHGEADTERVRRGQTAREDAGTHAPDHQRHRLFGLLHQRRLDCQRTLGGHFREQRNTDPLCGVGLA